VARSGDIENSDYKFTVSTFTNDRGPVFTSPLEDVTITLNSEGNYPSWELPSIEGDSRAEIANL
jgi:hypothetical protein